MISEVGCCLKASVGVSRRSERVRHIKRCASCVYKLYHPSFALQFGQHGIADFHNDSTALSVACRVTLLLDYEGICCTTGIVSNALSLLRCDQHSSLIQKEVGSLGTVGQRVRRRTWGPSDSACAL
uniref:Uncharacterized protein n=1 Tax=Ascaris lumbricoides TaxID=6252 RepID=A0A0M3IL37_ASCLU